MLTKNQLRQAIDNIDVLIESVEFPAGKFKIEKEKITLNPYFNTESKNDLEAYLQKLINECAFVDAENKGLVTLFINLQYFFNLHANAIAKELTLDFSHCPQIKPTKLQFERLGHEHDINHFKQKIIDKKLPEILKDTKTGLYTSPDDHKAHMHGSEGIWIFLSTQFERFKAFLHYIFAMIGIYIFETSPYQERNYLHTEIYASDSAIKPSLSNEKSNATHYWIGHASNLMSIPTDESPIHVLTDPVEGDLAPLLYPRMTEEGSLIDGSGEKRLPKVDLVVISHNHRDHVSEDTLKRLVKQQPKMIVPEGDEKLFGDLGFNDVISVKWWEQVSIANHQGKEVLRLTAVPARHWSGRSLNDAHQSAFNGYVLQSPKLKGDVYFAGDTALMDDAVVNPILDEFNIVTSIQPGGPDEGRAEMESSHQSSADALLMHFKILAAHYKKWLAQHPGQLPVMAEFLKYNQIKTIFNHTSTFKLGNLRLRDSFFSYQRIVHALKNEQAYANLPTHEMKVIDGILKLIEPMQFAENTKFNRYTVAQELLDSVIMPKIGQRQDLCFDYPNANKPFCYRDVITNGRALEEFDRLLQKHIHNNTTGKFNRSALAAELLESYQGVWHGFFSRSHTNLQGIIDLFKNDLNDLEFISHLSQLELKLKGTNLHGHMQSIIHYLYWLQQFATQNENNTLPAFKYYFICKQVRLLTDQESQSSGSVLGNDRGVKQCVFRELAVELANKPDDPSDFKTTVENWLGRIAEDGVQTYKDILSVNRSTLFMREKSRSLETVDQINDLLTCR